MPSPVPHPTPVKAAVRAHTLWLSSRPPSARAHRPDFAEGRSTRGDTSDRWPPYVLVLDNETRLDADQRLMVGCYQLGRWTAGGVIRCEEEGLFYADDLPESDPKGFALLRDYHARNKSVGSNVRWLLMSKSDFVRS